MGRGGALRRLRVPAGSRQRPHTAMRPHRPCTQPGWQRLVQAAPLAAPLPFPASSLHLHSCLPIVRAQPWGRRLGQTWVLTLKTLVCSPSWRHRSGGSGCASDAMQAFFGRLSPPFFCCPPLCFPPLPAVSGRVHVPACRHCSRHPTPLLAGHDNLPARATAPCLYASHLHQRAALPSLPPLLPLIAGWAAPRGHAGHAVAGAVSAPGPPLAAAAATRRCRRH